MSAAHHFTPQQNDTLDALTAWASPELGDLRIRRIVDRLAALGRSPPNTSDCILERAIQDVARTEGPS